MDKILAFLISMLLIIELLIMPLTSFAEEGVEEAFVDLEEIKAKINELLAQGYYQSEIRAVLVEIYGENPRIAPNRYLDLEHYLVKSRRGGVWNRIWIYELHDEPPPSEYEPPSELDDADPAEGFFKEKNSTDLGGDRTCTWTRSGCYCSLSRQNKKFLSRKPVPRRDNSSEKRESAIPLSILNEHEGFYMDPRGRVWLIFKERTKLKEMWLNYTLLYKSFVGLPPEHPGLGSGEEEVLVERFRVGKSMPLSGFLWEEIVRSSSKLEGESLRLLKIRGFWVSGVAKNLVRKKERMMDLYSCLVYDDIGLIEESWREIEGGSGEIGKRYKWYTAKIDWYFTISESKSWGLRLKNPTLAEKVYKLRIDGPALTALKVEVEAGGVKDLVLPVVSPFRISGDLEFDIYTVKDYKDRFIHDVAYSFNSIKIPLPTELHLLQEFSCTSCESPEGEENCDIVHLAYLALKGFWEAGGFFVAGVVIALDASIGTKGRIAGVILALIDVPILLKVVDYYLNYFFPTIAEAYSTMMELDRLISRTENPELRKFLERENDGSANKE